MKVKKSKLKKDNFSYYEGPTKNKYEGWTVEEIEKDIEIAKKESDKLKDWSEADF